MVNNHYDYIHATIEDACYSESRTNSITNKLLIPSNQIIYSVCITIRICKLLMQSRRLTDKTRTKRRPSKFRHHLMIFNQSIDKYSIEMSGSLYENNPRKQFEEVYQSVGVAVLFSQNQ